jgi:pimeloyl-ACP methyl ester carboxylesterase
LAAIAYVAICARMALVLTAPSRQPFITSPEHYGLSYESVTFPSRIDAITLDGWLLNPPSGVPARRPIVAVHGRGSDRTREADGRLLEIAAALVADGHPVLLFDLRGSGRSGGQRFTFGVQEVRDVGGAIDLLERRGLASDGVGLLGYSMGAATTLLLAPDEPLVRAVVEDSGYAELASLIDDQVPRASGLPGMFTPGMVVLARPLVGFDMYAIRPVDGVPALAARRVPLLVIHGEADPTVPVSHGQHIAAAYGSGVETLFVPGAGHVRSYETDPGTYLDRVRSFLGGS